MYTFADGADGRLGHGDKERRTTQALVQSLEGKNTTQVQCGALHTMVLTSNGYVCTRGNAEHGQFGIRNTTSKSNSLPCLIERLRDHNVVQITIRDRHCAVFVDMSPLIIRKSQQDSFNNKQHFDVMSWSRMSQSMPKRLFYPRKVSTSQPCFGVI